MNLYKINQLALEFRLDMGLDYNAPLDFFPVITNKIKNLTIVFLEMDDKISGACVKVDSQKIMFINSRHSKGRQTFTAAHEIYHLFYEDANFTICNLNSQDEVEKNTHPTAEHAVSLPEGADIRPTIRICFCNVLFYEES